MTTIINTQNLKLPATVTFDSAKVVLTGSNGAGKTTLLHCIAAAYTGKGMGGVDLASLSPTGKPSCDVIVDGKRIIVGDMPLFDLRALASLSGPQRAEYLFGLLGGKVEKKDIEDLVRKLTPAYLQSETRCVLGAANVDAAVKIAGEKKREADTRLDGYRALTKSTIECDRTFVESEIKRLEEIASDKFAAKRAEIIAEGKAVKARIAEKFGEEALDKDPGELYNKLINWKSESKDLADIAAAQQDTVNTLSGQFSAQRLMVNALNNANNCPTCGKPVEASLLSSLRAKLAQIEAKHKAADSDLWAMREDLSGYRDDIARGEELLKLLGQLNDLRCGLDGLEPGKHTPQAVADAKRQIEEHKALLAQYEQIENASKLIAATEEEAKTFRAIESALKNLKASVAQQAGFPPRVAATVQEVLGYTLGFGKVGSRMDITVTRDGENPRPITTLSAGEWQVVAAAFGLMQPDATVLVEAAEIDDANFHKLTECLESQDGLVVIADWRDRVTSDKWSKVEVKA